MGRSKPEMKIKKRSQKSGLSAVIGKSNPEMKIKKRSRELVENSESARDACFSDNDDKQSIVKKNEGDVAGEDRKAYKSKKARKNKSRDNPLPGELSIVVNNKDKSKKARKNTTRDDSLPSELNTVVNDKEVSLKGDGGKPKKKKKDGLSTSKKGKSVKEVQEAKSKKARKNLSRDDPVPSEVSTVVNDKEVSLKGDGGKPKKKKDGLSTNKSSKSVKEVQEDAMLNVYQISSGEEDGSKGMRKWIKEYHERRPGLKILQERIDEFITAYDEQEEQAKRERETKLAEEGWTVVVHRKGGKRTTDPESGVAVGSVAEAAVRDKLANKKNKDVGLDFYRFQRKEAHRSELMKLQSKFKEDKKRIQQFRAARKFRPY
ncbi:uncharacterized protein LOC104899684 isoform X2 [Beta vulgaris subsp. vulgaris]|nr:uncharacterized protein LOC104899684 isoform X2 [Beta vulgaris subsp. vulgaris]XP_010685222.2 uncharacterized protein LOC104899684 isoform X2 [Beta vulgaris subsp. vulgaris]XP_010685223.2 uncharacterized protein LOC104899684 isoform X2 [Beta vulgaris subsp. vulgaris]XP_010685224.2 uncharacterized protein LOC104899684 isoform X2 [Beta vulgaris subsp. vulgaris]XP_019106484.2 uncharacterized protein LOC104899684 isoform X2 [Beta vulgaris subsp. vulgaris]XP_048504172.1 uncharacterized protein L